ncbi:M20 family metallo-hydrolase [Herbaspirillum sp. YR522]|uniref:M20 family metallo-hydrolase n=1 Tax=Herbaspirillum sp. YR522 TaxID=1144342 RepID=UPI00026F5308|nr:M20 family metallo-hydrolase [Herbaspirillum sp. YR522]EJN10318.1 amidase, hydantoinase/carbamoylase family [Herbaspirillum sp. YR522]
MLVIDQDRVLASLQALARFGAQGRGVNRPALSRPDMQARQWLAAEMSDAGLAVTIDAVGNVFGRSRAARALLLGSHCDSVPTGGWLDGALGVIYGIEAARAMGQQYPDAEVGIDVVAFADEEGRYLSCLGSKWFCGELGAHDLAALKFDGVSFPEAARDIGLHPDIGALLDPARHVGYVEAHIEQGPRLDDGQLDLGIVTGIAGMRRFGVSFAGQADHAGTTPMALRRDAGMAALDFAVALRDRFVALRAPDAVWNFGAISFFPGVANVVPKEAQLTVEIRDLDVQHLDAMQACLEQLVRQDDYRAGVRIACTLTGNLAPARMDPALTQLLATASARGSSKIMRMHSGAIHDAMVMSRYLPSAMLFVPSIGGRSHDAIEDTAERHLRLGAKVFADAAYAMTQGAGRE